MTFTRHRGLHRADGADARVRVEPAARAAASEAGDLGAVRPQGRHDASSTIRCAIAARAARRAKDCGIRTRRSPIRRRRSPTISTSTPGYFRERRVHAVPRIVRDLPAAGRLGERIRASRASIIGTGRNLHVWTAYPASIRRRRSGTGTRVEARSTSRRRRSGISRSASTSTSEAPTHDSHPIPSDVMHTCLRRGRAHSPVPPR